jgi:hypothetical protein
MKNPNSPAPGLLLYAAVAMIVIVYLSSCSTVRGIMGRGSGDTPQPIAMARITAQSDPAKKPEMLAQYDGHALVGWSAIKVKVELLAMPSMIPIFVPRVIDTGKAQVSMREKGIDWSGNPDDPLPGEVRYQFSDVEIALWALIFTPPAVTP